MEFLVVFGARGNIQAPSTKLQRSTKLQTSNAPAYINGVFGDSLLDVLELGGWCLELFLLGVFLYPFAHSL
jgi:hypothetical protein